jgi:hypothetical protein
MAITSTLTTSFKTELLKGTHNFATGGNSFKLALYTSSATLGATTTAFTTTGQAAGTNYTSGGITARGCMIYNDTAAGDPSVATIDFGGDKTSTAGDFTIVFPAAASSTAIIRIA